MVYPSAIAHPPASVTIAKLGEASFVSHIPAKSSQGAANNTVMIARPVQWGIARPSAMTDRHAAITRSEEHTSELQSRRDIVCRLLLENKKKIRVNQAGLVYLGSVSHPMFYRGRGLSLAL